MNLQKPSPLDFTGGPWLLRNGDIVKGISKPADEVWTSDNWLKDALEWNDEGNCISKTVLTRHEFDIMASCMNWKYLREHGGGE